MIKIFEITHTDKHKEWIAADTLIEALRLYLGANNLELYDIEDSEIKEVDYRDNIFETGFILDENGIKTSFGDYIKENGKGYLSGTMYLQQNKNEL